MNVKTLVAGALLPAVMTFSVGLTGCNAGSGEIPLAKVPPPPPGFGQPQKSAKAPKGASPENASELYK
jgi:hypothetical protein